MQQLYSAGSLSEAYLLRGLLVRAGIEARVLNEFAGGALGELPFAEVTPSIWIEEERDFARARQIVESYENAVSVPGTTRCRNCGEESPNDFTICWNCQQPM